LMILGEWQPKAECLGEDTDFFYIDERSPNQPAMQVCARCSVRTQCLITAIESNERWGIWGGMLSQERSRLRNAVMELPRNEAREILAEVAKATPIHRWRT